MRRIGVPLTLAAISVAVACAESPATDEAAPDADATAPESAPASPPTLGPVDGLDLARADLDRITVGEPAPDFRLMSYRGDVLTLSENRGVREILLVFYRGHW